MAVITSGDFNDYKQTGFWVVSADTANLQNCPITEGGSNVRGLLIVLYYGNMGVQITFETRTSGKAPNLYIIGRSLTMLIMDGLNGLPLIVL